MTTATEPSTPLRNPPLILVADDQADVRESLRLLLETEGYAVFAESPLGDPLLRRLRSLRYLHNCSNGYRLKRPSAGWVYLPLRERTFSRRTQLGPTDCLISNVMLRAKKGEVRIG